MFVLFRALVWSSLFVAVVLIYIPSRFISQFGLDRTASVFSATVGILIGTIGGTIAVWSIASFVAIGRGTPAPFDPPRRLVTRGPYQFVRNPMYIGAGLALIGASLVYRSWMIVGYVLILFVVTHCFVVYYEEPTLQRLFGSEYVEYQRKVRRWFPRTTSEIVARHDIHQDVHDV